MTTTTTATGTTSRILKKEMCDWTEISILFHRFWHSCDLRNYKYFICCLIIFHESIHKSVHQSAIYNNEWINLYRQDIPCIYTYIWLCLHLFRCQFIYTYSEVGVEWYKTWKSDLKSVKCRWDEHISQHPCKKLQFDQMCFGSVVCNQVLNTNQNLNAASVNLGSNIYLVISLLFFLFFFWSGTLAALVASEYHNKNSWMSHAIS